MRLRSLLLTIAVSVSAWTLGRTTYSAEVEPPRQWIAVVADDLRPSLEPLMERRRAQGWRVVVVPTSEVANDGPNLAEAIQRKIKSYCQDAHVATYVLLCGSPFAGTGHGDVSLPATLGRHGRMRGQWTDHYYGDPDEEAVSRVAVGRFPAASAAEAASMVRKTLEFEDRPSGPWSNRLSLLVGDPGGASAIERRLGEMMVQTLAGKRLRDLNPLWRPNCIADASGTEFSVPTAKYGPVARRILEEGHVFACYAGHSDAEGPWSFTHGYVLPRSVFAELRTPGGGVFVSSGCFGCQISDTDAEGYVITGIRNPHGPAAAIGAFGETYAAFGYLALEGLMDCLQRDAPPSTLGEYWLAMQKSMARGRIDPIMFWVLDQADGTKGQVPLAAQRPEHVEMWTLLGDPALKIPIERPSLEVDVEGEILRGGRITVTASIPDDMVGGTASIRVEPRILRLLRRSDDEIVESSGPPIEPPLAATDVEVQSGRLVCTLELPESIDSEREFVVRVYLSRADKHLSGHRLITIESR